jgi:hypothetical protein
MHAYPSAYSRNDSLELGVDSKTNFGRNFPYLSEDVQPNGYKGRTCCLKSIDRIVQSDEFQKAWKMSITVSHDEVTRLEQYDNLPQENGTLTNEWYKVEQEEPGAPALVKADNDDVKTRLWFKTPVSC